MEVLEYVGKISLQFICEIQRLKKQELILTFIRRGNFLLITVDRQNQKSFTVSLACKQAHIWEHSRERLRANSKAKRSFGRSLVTRREESEPALISVKFYGGFNSQHGARRTVGCVYLLRASKVPVCFRVKILFEEGAGR